MNFQIGDRVKILSNPVYGGIGNINDIGVITRIRNRYKNTPNEYNQYKVHIDGKQNSHLHTIDDLYHSYSICLVHGRGGSAEIP
jgi:hypothetical protein